MPFYEVNLCVFAAANAALICVHHCNERQRARSEELKRRSGDQDERQQLLSPSPELKTQARDFQLRYFSVYALAVAADWLQGPHIYAIYKYEKDIPEKLVAALYATGFVSGAVSASFAGAFADRYGRRLACLVYCVAYSITCLSMLSDDRVILFIGRICGGIATTLLYSVFEAWLVTEYHQRGLSAGYLKLSSIFGKMTTLSSFVAILSGVAGDTLVASFNGARVSPFVAGAACAIAAALLILKLWTENYGVRDDAGLDESRQATPTANIQSGIHTILADKRILVLALVSTFFEGTMYLFVFFWSAALQSAHARTGSSSDLPFGLIFSSFMCAMMAGSMLFSLAVPTHTTSWAYRMLLLVMFVTSFCLSGAALFEDEKVLFWQSCMIELCIGAYFPSMSYLKSDVVEDGVRGRVYSILRLPLNLFVVIAHSLDQEGDTHRNHVFLTCAAFLMVSFLITKAGFSP